MQQQLDNLEDHLVGQPERRAAQPPLLAPLQSGPAPPRGTLVLARSRRAGRLGLLSVRRGHRHRPAWRTVFFFATAAHPGRCGQVAIADHADGPGAGSRAVGDERVVVGGGGAHRAAAAAGAAPAPLRPQPRRGQPARGHAQRRHGQ
eukprot:scaffold33987_cov124-Isochrysis_galbana.AAC.1